jgi:hypothetical protein
VSAERRTRSRTAVCIGALLALASCLGTLAADPLEAASPKLEVVATNLNNPHKLFVGKSGAIYVAEAGTGGRSNCLGKGPTKTCVGLTGSIVRVAGGSKKRVLTGLWSGARTNGELAEGPAAVIVKGSVFEVLLQNGSIDAKGANDLGPDGTIAGDLITSPPGRVDPKVIADFAAFEAAHNPDRGRGPGTRFGDPSIDSDPYAFVAYRGGYAVADAAGNDLLWVSPKGSISVIAVFPTQTVRLTAAERAAIGAPALKSISVQSVPTSVTVGPDGALYVGELTGVPFAPGKARVWRVSGSKTSLYASGFTNISDLAFDGKNLLVLELTTKGLLAKRSHGALIRLAPDGRRKTIAAAGLVDPSGLAVANGSIYISNNGLFPGTGADLRGELVRLPASLGS